MSTHLKADICVIGAGSAGLSVASGAAQLGRKTVLIEKGEMGGDCLNTGCVPSKALIAAASRARQAASASSFGIEVSGIRIDGAAVHAHVHETIATIAPHDSQVRFEGLGVTVIRAAARFVDHRTVEAGETKITARRFVIATGSRATMPPIPGLSDIPVFTNETIFEKNFIPAHLIVIGAGPVGIELAQAHCRLGAAVTIVEAQRALPREDVSLARVVLDSLSRDGVTLHENTTITAAKRSETGVVLQLLTPHGSEVLEGSHVLVAAGRKPNVEELGLEAAGVAYDAKGIRVDHRLKTTNKRIYAIGDVAGGPQFTHVASYHAGLVIRHALFRQPIRVDHSQIPRVTYSDPEIASIGLSEDDARKAHGKISVITADFADIDRAIAGRATAGFLKLVAGRSGHILGVSIVGEHAGELIWPWALAIGQQMKLSTLAGSIVPYPTLSDISKRAAGAYYTPALFGRSARLLVRVLSWFG